MLKALRKKGFAKKVLWAVAIVIIISFGFLGSASLLNNTTSKYAGSVYGKKISFSQFEKVYKQVQLEALMHYGKDFKTINSMLNLEAQTWNRLILLHEANRKRIKVTDKEVITTIEQYPYFQRDGQFDSLLYDNALRYAFQIKPRDFEESIRNTIKLSKLQKMQTENIEVSDKELLQSYKKQNEKAQVSYVLINATQFLNDVTIEDAYLKQYYTEHKTEFLRPPSIKVDYVKIPFPETKKEEQKEGEKAPENSKFETYQKAEEMYQDLVENSNFDAIAKKYNVEVKTTNYFSIEKPLFIFGSFDALNKIFHLKVDEINAPLETTEGMFIVRMKEKRDSYIPEFKDALEDVKTSAKNNEAKRIAQIRAKQYLEKFQEGIKNQLSFPSIAKSLRIEAHQTPLFNRGQYLPIVGLEKNFQETAFKLTPDNRLSDIIGTSKGYCILYQDSYVPFDSNKFQEEKEAFKQNLLIEKKMQSFNDYFARLKTEANLTSNRQKDNF